jgi:hypothetical protein
MFSAQKTAQQAAKASHDAAAKAAQEAAAKAAHLARQLRLVDNMRSKLTSQLEDFFIISIRHLKLVKLSHDMAHPFSQGLDICEFGFLSQNSNT